MRSEGRQAVRTSTSVDSPYAVVWYNRHGGKRCVAVLLAGRRCHELASLSWALPSRTRYLLTPRPFLVVTVRGPLRLVIDGDSGTLEGA